MKEICQTHLPYMPWMDARERSLPGTQAIDLTDWLIRDEVYGAQMAYRSKLLEERRSSVLNMLDGSEAACIELLELICKQLGRSAPSGDHPLALLNAITQEDWCILEKPEALEEHVLTAGLLCFPASWTLSEKLGRPLTRIHKPVPGYANQIATRVQRMFDGLQPDKPIARANFLIYDTPELHHPLTEAKHRPVSAQGPHWVRVERQTLRKLPRTSAIVFGIHSYVQSVSDLPPPAFEALAALRPHIAIS